jgi:outer membrane immunogenic protein
MKSVLLASVGVLTLAATLATAAGSASAADLPRRYEPIVPKAPIFSPVYNWTGFYIGINGGGAWGHSDWDSAGSFNLSGGLVGGTVGYNWQTGPWVLGVEGDVDWSRINGTVTNALCGLGCTTSNDWLATVRGRAGYAFDRIMPYITGGLALGNVNATTPFFAGKDEVNAGWTVGAGLEVALMNNWTAKAEYLYVDLGQINCGISCGALVNDNVSFTSHIVRGGINYRF